MNNNTLDNSKRTKISSTIKAHFLMVLLVVAWGFDYVPAKWGIEVMPTAVLLLYKYGCGLLFMLIVKVVTRNKALIRVKDIPLFLLCALFGQLLYYYGEYTAMDYLPVALITIVLAFVPVLSIIIERVLFGIRANKIIVVGIAVLMVGIVLVLGADFSILLKGRGLGYIFAFGAVVSWNVYNFVTASLDERYDTITLACTQMLCTVLLVLPIALHSMPDPEIYTTKIILAILWMGLIDSGIGFIVYIFSIEILGPTTTALYSNFLPVTTIFFGAIFLHESITLLQIIGGIIVIVSGFVVIKEKGRLDEERLKTH